MRSSKKKAQRKISRFAGSNNFLSTSMHFKDYFGSQFVGVSELGVILGEIRREKMAAIVIIPAQNVNTNDIQFEYTFPAKNCTYLRVSDRIFLFF